jgi:YD repeat-containing protein
MVRSIQRFDGTTVSNAYDRHGRLAGTQYPDTAYAYGYLANGLLSAVTNGANKVEFAYDDWNRLVAVTNIAGGVTNAVQYAHDPAGNVTNRVTAAGTTSYAYDAGERLASIQGMDGMIAYSYNPWNGLVQTETQDGLRADCEYDALDRVTGIDYRDASSNLVYALGYGYDVTGMITQKVTRTTGATNTVAYAYDTLDRLIREDDGVTAETGSIGAVLAGTNTDKAWTTFYP